MRIAALAFLLFGSLSLMAEVPAAAQPAQVKDSQVTIRLEDYDALRDANASPSATVIDSILIAGSFAEHDLTIALAGRTTGKRPLANVLEQMNEVTISGCKGDGIITRSVKGSFDLIPLAPAFTVTCDLRVSGSDRLRMHATSSVLAVRSTVTDGELVAGDEDDRGARDYTLVRHVASTGGDTIAATATGRYQITLLPDATRFRYAIDVHNPNRTTSTLEVKLQSNEHLQQIDSAAPYEVREGIYVFSIPPGDSTITMTGELRGTSFTAPVSASLQYVVLESHPLLRPTVETPAKRISVGETGVTPRYRGALAFETGTARIAWKVTRLEAMHAISYAVNDASHRFFIPIDGPVLGETTYALRNEGAADLLLPSTPEPTYVSFDGEPVLMTKNDAGQLAVPLSSGEQQVLVQHRQPLRRGAGFVFGSLIIPQLDVAATNTSVTLSYPGQWVPLFAQFASHATFWTPAASQILLFSLLAFWIERLLAWAGFAMKTRFTIALLLALASTITTSFLIVTLLLFGAVSALWIASRPTRRVRMMYVVMSAMLVFGTLFLAMIGGVRKEYNVTSSAPSREEVVTDTVVMDTAMTSEPATTGGTQPPSEAPPRQVAYQGLPAKFTLPGGEHTTYFQQELLRTDRTQVAFIIAISLALTNAIGLLLGVIALALLWRKRHAFAELLARMPWKIAPQPVPEG